MTKQEWDELEASIEQPEPILKTALKGRSKLDELLTIDSRRVPVPELKNPGPSKADIIYMGIRRGAKTLVAALPAAATGAALLTAKGVSLPVAGGAALLGALTTAAMAGTGKGLKESKLSQGKTSRDPLTWLLKLLKVALEAFIKYRTQTHKGGTK